MKFRSFIERMFSGRIGRGNYVLGQILFFVVFFLGAGPVGWFMTTFKTMLSGCLMLVWVATYVTVTFSLHVRRFHDLGQSGWLSLLFFLPIADPILIVILVFVSGTRGGNGYGERPDRDERFFNAVFNVVHIPLSGAEQH
jgi:uncharacterized membrane protein YhaH (DUF805 family)